MHRGTFFHIMGLALCCGVALAQSCSREPEDSPPAQGEAHQSEAILDEVKERLTPTLDPDLQDWLGDVRMISAADAIAAYRITPKQDTSQENIAGYPILERGPELTPEQRIQLQWLLLDHQTYRVESRKKCLFLPEYAFVFQRGDATVTALVSTFCPQTEFLEGERRLRRDRDPALPKFQELLETLFPQAEAEEGGES